MDYDFCTTDGARRLKQRIEDVERGVVRHFFLGLACDNIRQAQT